MVPRGELASAGLGVVYKGQLYRRIAMRPHIRSDGTVTELAIWESRCPVCGEKFAITTSRTTRLREPNRR